MFLCDQATFPHSWTSIENDVARLTHPGIRRDLISLLLEEYFKMKLEIAEHFGPYRIVS